MPAPPPLSEPAIVSAEGISICLIEVTVRENTNPDP
jgi:hypothetical protein